MEQLGIMGVLGYVLQWAKGPKKIPTWLSYIIFAGLSIGVYIWRTPGIEEAFVQDWRATLSGFAGFVVGIEGFTALWRKAKVAPKTDSL